MKISPLRTALAAFGIAIIVFLSCSSGPLLEFPGKDEPLPPSSSGGASSSDGSSGSGEIDGSSSSGEAADDSSSSSEEVYCDDADKCGGKCYDRETHFCINGRDIYDRCGGKTYNVQSVICCGGTQYPKSSYACCGSAGYLLSGYGCRDTAVLTRCGENDLYNPLREFCAGNGTVQYLCNGRQFDYPAQSCIEGEIMGECGEELSLNYEVYFCQGGEPYLLCGGSGYNPAAQFCSGSKVYDKCGGSDYDPAAKFCYGGAPYDLCGGKDYNPTSDFCFAGNGTVHSKCNGEQYNPLTEGCCNNSKYPLKRVHYGREKEQFCDGRDGKAYVKVDIGTQTWMAENLNYNASSSNDFGGRYPWTTANEVCPSGWHLPSDADWNALMKCVNPSCSDNSECADAGTKLKAASGWYMDGNGTDDYGFSALPGGCAITFGLSDIWWSSGPNNRNICMTYYSTSVFISNSQSGSCAVRCVKD